MTTKYETNCPVLEKQGIHWSDKVRGSEEWMLKNDPCLNCPIDKCRLGKRGFMVKSNLPRKEINNVAT